MKKRFMFIVKKNVFCLVLIKIFHQVETNMLRHRSFSFQIKKGRVKRNLI